MYIRVFAIGLPMGTVLCQVSDMHVHAVTSTDASVGPYKLCNRHCGSCSWKRLANIAGSASPLHITSCKFVHRPTSPCSRNTCSMEGTKCMVVILYRWIASTR